MLRLLIIVEPGLNGVFRHVEGLCDYLLPDLRFRVGLAYSSVRSSVVLDKLITRVSNAGGPVLDLNVGNSPSLLDVRAFLDLFGLIRNFRPNVIHAHSSKAGGLARLLWFVGCDVPVFYTPHAYYGLNKSSGLIYKIFNLIESFLGRIGVTINVSKSERFFALNQLGLMRNRLIHVFNAVDCNYFTPPTPVQLRSIRGRLGIPAGAWVVGTVGRYSSQKDPLMLYLAIEQLMSADASIWFVHLGEGELYGDVSNWLKGKSWSTRVVRVCYDSMPVDFYRALDVFALSSRYEGLPISVIEALATGLPLALTNCPGCDDFRFMGLDAIAWAKVGDPLTMLNAIVRIRSRGDKITNHHHIADKLFNPDVTYGRIKGYYHAAHSDFHFSPVI